MSAFKITADCSSYDLARSIAGALQETVVPEPDATTLFENGAGWRVEAYFQERPFADSVAVQLRQSIASADLPPLVPSDVPNENWVARSQESLPPVVAGRFTVHGSHDRAAVPRGPNALEIDAGEAFGTAHHATTQGCLEVISTLGRRSRPPRRVLDLGCGSGVLAIAMARILPAARILASDNDAVAIDVARSNAHINGVAGRIKFSVAAGFAGTAHRRSEPFDLIVANILAGPLIGLAPKMARTTRVGAHVVLSGLLVAQSAEVVAAYRARGFAVVGHRRIAGWSTLTLLRRPCAPSRGSTRAA